MTRVFKRSLRKLGLLAAHLGVTQPEAADLVFSEAIANRGIPFDADPDEAKLPRRKRKAC